MWKFIFLSIALLALSVTTVFAQSVGGGGSHTSVATSGGALWSWGTSSGQLCDGTATTRVLPVNAGTLSNVTAVAAGNAHTLVIKSDGTLWACGYNANGQIGDRTTTQRKPPGQVTALSTVTAIAVGSSHSDAQKTVRSVTVWWLDTHRQ